MQRGPLLQLLATVAACGGLPLACSNACTGVDCGLGAHCNADKAAAAAAAAATPQHNDGQTYFCVCQGDYNGSAVRGGPATCTLPPRECCFLLCHCWVDLDWRLHITSGFRLMLMVPVACGIALSCYNMAMHARAYLAMDSGLLLTHGQGDAQDQKATLYRQMRLSFILVLTAAPVLGLVAWCQLYIGGFHAEADAIVMVYEAVAINCFLQMVISFSGGRDAVAQVLEARDMRILWMIPIKELDDTAKPCARKCTACCMRYNCKLWTYSSSASLLKFWIWSVRQMLPVKFLLAMINVVAARSMDDGGEGVRFPINLLNVLSMIFAVRANVALYFELRDKIAGLRPVLKYISCRAVLSACLSQRFMLDVTIRDPTVRFELLNLLLCFEMPLLALVWFFVFSHNDPVFAHILRGVEQSDDNRSSERNHALAPGEQLGTLGVERDGNVQTGLEHH